MVSILRARAVKLADWRSLGDLKRGGSPVVYECWRRGGRGGG